ncbi:hypothetical protein [Atribacter laminatus]|jgi:hypothetical protein|uniref:Uncharacterized protein n=1 Tax=Atribacter laminatus TaxID=2847778 RepID=A0A7T1AL90_ATRLM|nr:hypothetical protein [Atribacter laminatus]QPM67978.1 hypothetical protein RT761_01192 [Atribacter laminatus]
MRKKVNIIFIISLISLFFIVGCTNPPSPTPSPTPEIVSEVFEAKDWGITQANLEGVRVPMDAVWSVVNITPEGLVGYTTYLFTYIDAEGTWTIEVGYPIVLEPIYDVEIFQNGQSIWEGSIQIPFD